MFQRSTDRYDGDDGITQDTIECLRSESVSTGIDTFLSSLHP